MTFSFNINYKEYISLASIMSNLMLDPCISLSSPSRKDERSINIRVTPSFLIIFDGVPIVIPKVSVHAKRILHRKQQLLTHIATKYLSLGSFLVSRTIRGEHGKLLPESSEETTLIPHLDMRHRRLLSVWEGGSGEEIEYWYLPLMLTTGLHRWGLSWRKIIASTFVAHLHAQNRRPKNEEIDLLTLGLVEASYNSWIYRHIYREVGEEAYAYFGELLKGIYGWLDKRAPSILKNKSPDTRLRLLYELIGDAIGRNWYSVKNTVERTIWVINGEYEQGESSNNLGEINVEPFLSTHINLYENGIKPLIEGTEEKIEETGDKEPVFLLFPTESWSVFNIYSMANLYAAKKISRNFQVALFYTPQTLTQVLFSILTLPLPGKKRNKHDSMMQFLGNYGNMRNLCSVESNKAYKELKIEIKTRNGTVNVKLLLIPLVGKTPSIVYEELAAIIGEFKKKGMEPLCSHPMLTSISSVTVALMGLQGGRTGSSPNEQVICIY